MKFCSNCGKSLVENEKFCSNCGNGIEPSEAAPAEKTVVSEVPLEDDSPDCNTEEEIIVEQQSEEGSEIQKSIEKVKNVSEELVEKVKKPLKKFNKKLVAIAGGAVVLALVVAIVLSMIPFGGSTDKNHILYIKDKEIFYNDIDKLEPWQVTDKLLDVDGYDNSVFLNGTIGTLCGYYTTVTDSGRIFYVDKISDDAEGVTLYYRNIGDATTEPVKIDSDIRYCSVSEKGDTVIYTKGDTQDLYRHNLKDKEKIASKVSAFVASKDCKEIGYITEESEVYYLKEGKEMEKVDIDVTSIEYISEDLGEVYYIREDALYKKAPGKDKVKIATDIDSVVKIYEDGEVYYTKANSETKNLIDFVDDDRAESDALLTKPTAPNYSDYYVTSGYYYYYFDNEAYNRDYEAYRTKYEEYNKKLSRDKLREELKNTTIAIFSELYCYNGSEENKITDEFYSSGDYRFAEEKAVGVISTSNISSLEKPKLSEISYTYELNEAIESVLATSAKKHIICGTQSIELEETNLQSINLNAAGTSLYYMSNISEENQHGDLYYVAIKNGKISEPELYDSDVYELCSEFVSNDKFVYYKEADGEKGDLYINKSLVDYDCDYFNYAYNEDSDVFVYISDWSDSSECGVLKMYKEGKSTKISDDVYSFDFTPAGEILYLYDYSTEKCRGELYVRKKNENIKVDSDVVSLLPQITSWDIYFYGLQP